MKTIQEYIEDVKKEFRKEHCSVRGNQADQLQQQIKPSTSQEDIERFIDTAFTKALTEALESLIPDKLPEKKENSTHGFTLSETYDNGFNVCRSDLITNINKILGK